MSAVETYNEKFLECQRIDAKIARITQRQTTLTGLITSIDEKIATKTSEKATADAELATAQGNLPSDIEVYQAKFLACKRIDDNISQLNTQKDTYNNRLTKINEDLAAANAEKTTIDSDLTTAQGAL